MGERASWLEPQSLAFLEDLYDRYRRDPSAVAAEWRSRFAELERAPSRDGGRPHAAPLRDGVPAPDAAFLERVEDLVRAYRVEGHRAARIDPLERPRRCPVELDPAFHGLTREDLDRAVSGPGLGTQPLRALLERLSRTYCEATGVQFMHLEDLAEQSWLIERMEASGNRAALAPEEQSRILERLVAATAFEEFMQKRFLGAKTFSLEGAETLIPLLDLAIEEAARQGVSEIVMGMAHRGRLNVLVNVLGQPVREIFAMFRGESAPAGGDVQYHLGYSAERATREGKPIRLALCFNPSHLEFVDPVVLGRVRARQDRAGDARRSRAMGLLIHGDAAFAGQGVVQETLNLSGLAAYRTGGTLHVVVNNQIGFTTPPEEGRSCRYATDVAKLLQAPIFHVNGEDPEAVANAVRLAMEFRASARRDAVIDLYGYRRRGHNETDEPSFTQPVLYRIVEERVPVRENYRRHLAGSGAVAPEVEALAREAYRRLDAESSAPPPPRRAPAQDDGWDRFRGGPEDGMPEAATALPRERLGALLERLTATPPGFELHPKLRAAMDRRRKMARGQLPLDWSAAEALALATLAAEGVPVRLAGQDSARGTFSQRHAVLLDYRDGRPYVPLRHVAAGQAPVEIYNSPLSEAAALGFEYGYSLDAPQALVLWEAQFGDFCNAAQVVVDQFLASAERKWGVLSGLVLLLPHGIEGQGPEHSSARIERFLSLAAEDNLQLAQPSTPAQLFHLLRRQALRPWRKPLVAFTPKSLLRHPECVSPIEELAEGGFRRALADPEAGLPERVILCSGKVYYELARARRERGARDIAIARLEQLYPLPEEVLLKALAGVPEDAPVTWVQEEPGNMGAWPHLRCRFGDRLLGRPLRAVHRPVSSSPASGSKAAYQREQERLIQEAFA